MCRAYVNSSALFKDVAGWKKLVDKLSSKCLIIADSALQKGLPVVMQSKEQQPVCARLSIQEDEGHVEIDGKVDTEGEEVGGVERLSCVAMSWKNSLSSTMDRIDHLNGEPMCLVCGVARRSFYQ